MHQQTGPSTTTYAKDIDPLRVQRICRFPAVALQWFQALLTDCEAPRHGVDLFGRDALLLGRCVPDPLVTRRICWRIVAAQIGVI